MTDAFIWTSAQELAELYRRRETSPVEVVESILERIEEVDGRISAMTRVTADQARADAKEADARFARGEELPRLFGVPLTVKDLIDTAGVVTTYGSPHYASHVPDQDDIGWARLKAAGAILIGKTTTPEFGLLGVTESHLTGSTSTPWRPGFTSGGSSGGAAAATAAGIAPIAWGSDGGGSIRVPSSLCGAVGFKPTAGRLAHRDAVDPDSTEGPIARTVVDVAIAMDATVGPHPSDRFSLPTSGERFAAAAEEAGDLSGMRIAVSVDANQGPVDPRVRAVFAEAVEALRLLGAIVEEVELHLPDAYEFFVAYWGPEYIETVEMMQREGIDTWPLMTDMADAARALPRSVINAAQRTTKTAIFREYARVFSVCDLLVTPTTPIPSFAHVGDMGGLNIVDGTRVPHAGIGLHRLTEPPSHAGIPALSVPAGFTSDGLPVGLQVIGPRFADARVLAAGARFERASGISERHPTL